MDWFILILLGTIWGTSYLFIKLGVAEIPPVTFAAGRVVIAGLVLLVAVLARRERIPPFSPRGWWHFLALGVLNCVIPYTLISWGETEVSSGLAAILVGAMPIFTVLIAHFTTHDEKITRLKLVGIFLGFVGVVVIFSPELAGGIRLTFWGMIAIVAAALSYAGATVVAHRFVGDTPRTVVSTLQMLSAAVILVPVALVVDRPFGLTPSFSAWGSLLALSLVGTSFAYILYYWLIANTGPTRASLVTYISPAAGLALGAFVLKENIAPTAIGGLLLIIAGIALVNRVAETPVEEEVLEGEAMHG